MKNKAIIGIALILLASVNACKSDEQTHNSSENKPTTQQVKQTSTPKEIINSYLTAVLKQRDFDTAFKYISEADKKHKDKSQYMQERHRPELDELFKNTSSFEIVDIETKPDTAKVSILLETIDMEKIFKEALGEKNLFALASMNQEEVEKMTDENLAHYKDGSKNPPMIKESQDLNLIKENGEWKVFLDWGAVAEEKAAKNPELKVGQEGALLSDSEKGNVMLKLNSVRFSTESAPEGKVFCIVNVTVSNQMEGQYTEIFDLPLASAALYTNEGSKYKREFFPSDKLGTKSYDNINPLNPGKATTGDMVFPIDKNSTKLKLVLDAGFDPIPDRNDYKSDTSLSFELGDVAL